MKYKWHIKEQNEISKEFLKTAFNSEIIARLLLNRGINSVDKAKAFLEPKFYQESKPEEIPDLLKAKDRILKAISKNEKITIFGDYDVDGVTSTSCLLITLRQFTDKVDFYIPSRLTEGYGLNCGAVKTISKKHKANLLITCDCGITNHKEIELANELGMDVIVTDHHSLPEILPPACAVLNPKQLPADHKLHFLPGVGVAYKLAEAILDEKGEGRREKGEGRIDKSDLLDLVTLGMIADLAPLVDENRYLVQIGLPKLASTKKVGLQELLRICGLKKNENGSVSTDHIGFGIAPRINAIGRLADAALAVKLLTGENLLEAVQIATELDYQNKERQILCEETLKEALTFVSEQIDLKKDKCIVLAKEGWHHGILGIVASRVLEKYNLPTILIGIDKEQNIARGSGRSIEQLNITEALTECSMHLEKFGGHKAACGLSIKPEKIEIFILEFGKKVSNILSETDLGPVLKIDSELPLSELNFDLIEKINKLSPFGLGNPLPFFASEEVEITGARTIGKNGQHLKLLLKPKNSSKTFEALIWNQTSGKNFQIGNKIKIAYTPKLNHYNSEVSIQLEVKDWQVEERNGELAKRRRSEKEIEIYDFREKMQECLDTILQAQTIFFAETEQKDFLPLKTHSRDKIIKTENLVFLETPPDESIFLEIIDKSFSNKIFFAFSSEEVLSTQHATLNTMKKLIGMLKYVKSSKNSFISEIELESALGINKTALAYALEILSKIGYLSFNRQDGNLNIDILNTTRQNFIELIEYKLFTSELKKIMDFKQWFYSATVTQIAKLLEENKILVKPYLVREKVLL